MSTITVYQNRRGFRVVSGEHAPTKGPFHVRTYRDAAAAYTGERLKAIRAAIARIAPADRQVNLSPSISTSSNKIC